jgi:hypothetical protein
LESASFKLRSEFYNLFSVMDNVIDSVKVLASSKNIKIIKPSNDFENFFSFTDMLGDERRSF